MKWPAWTSFLPTFPLCHPPIVFTECFLWMFQTKLWQNFCFICQCGSHLKKKKNQNNRALSWLQKGTKMRLRCIASLDSVQQLRRVLLCVCLCSWAALAQAPVIFTELRLMSGWRRRQCHLMNNVWFDKTQMDNYQTHHKRLQASR